MFIMFQKSNLLNISQVYTVRCHKCIKSRRLICTCNDNNVCIDYICNNLLNCKNIILNGILLTNILGKIIKITALETL